MFAALNLSDAQETFLGRLAEGLRPGQDRLAHWQSGEMAIAAVPGSGKSHALAIATVLTLARAQLSIDRQLVIVTFTRSAAEAIRQKIMDYLREAQLPLVGYSVQTIHGLALQIAAAHPEVSGLDLNSARLQNIPPEHPIVREAVARWIDDQGDLYQRLCGGATKDPEPTEQLRRRITLATEVLPKLAYSVIHEAKSSNLSPGDLRQLSGDIGDEYQLLAIAAGIYEHYRRLKREANLLDYDDLILGAIRILQQPELRDYWQSQIYGVFEDEAQDSSLLQGELLQLLATNPITAERNLVRVGDPNQAINSTFTSADPFYFNQFCQQVDCGQIGVAGRSNIGIIQAANTMLKWVSQTISPPDRFAFRDQKIFPVPLGDPQADANPAVTGDAVELHYPADIYCTVRQMGDRLDALLQKNPSHSAAILVRQKRQGEFVLNELSERFCGSSVQLFDGRQGSHGSKILRELSQVLKFLQRPHSPEYFQGALQVLGDRQNILTQHLTELSLQPEVLLYPSPLDVPSSRSGETEIRQMCQRLLKARWELPHYQLIPFLGIALNYNEAELATVQKIAEHIHQQSQGRKSLPRTLEILTQLLRGGFEDLEIDNDLRYTRPGQITVLTMHKAKGLDWDYVFLPFLHASEIPGESWIPTAAKFLGDYNLPDVARTQIRQFVHRRATGGSPGAPKSIATLWEEAQQLKTEEEYRLLYVAMTRAKRLLWMSAAQYAPFWGSFRPHQSRLRSKASCPIFTVLEQVRS